MAIILPENESNEEQGEELKYQATEKDEEEFCLMYNMQMQPSEVKALDPDYKKWLIARFMAQKHMENEYIQRQRLMQTIGPNLHVDG
jgi:hypothetical protein